MSTSKSTRSDPLPSDPRDDLKESMEHATVDEPETFRDEANREKVVEIPPDKTEEPIRGIDPVEKPGR